MQDEKLVKAYPNKVQQVLSYVTNHPIPVEGVRMYYKSIGNLPNGRIAAEVAESLETLDFGVSGVKAHTAEVVQGLLYLACGGVDEAHDLGTLHLRN